MAHKGTGNLYNIDSDDFVKVDPDKWSDPLTRQAEAARVIKQPKLHSQA